MEKQTPEQQQIATKDSTDSLRKKLIKAGRDETEVKSMERPALLEAWAKVKPKQAAELSIRERDLDAEIKLAQMARDQERWEMEKSRLKAEYDAKIKREAVELEKLKVETDNAKRAEERATADAKRAEERANRAAMERDKAAVERDRAANELKAANAQLKIDAELKMREKELEAAMERDRDTLQLQRDIADRQNAAEDDRRRNDRQERAERDRDPAHRMKVFGDAIRNSLVKMADDPLDAIVFFDNVEKLFKTYSVPDRMQVDLMRPYLSMRAAAIVARMDDETIADYEATKKLLLYELKLVPSVFRERFNRVEKTENETYVRYASRLKGLLKHYISERGVTSFEDLIELLVCDRIKGTLPETCLKFVLSNEAANEGGWLKLKQLTELVDNFYACTWNSQTGRSGARQNYGPKSGGAVGPNRWGAGGAATPWGAGTAAAPLSGASLTASPAPPKSNALEQKSGKRGCFVCQKVGCHSRNHQTTNPKRINRTILEGENVEQDEGLFIARVETCARQFCIKDGTEHSTLSYVDVCLRDRPDAVGAAARGLHDSGAEVSLIRESYAAELGLQIEPHGTLTLRGIVGNPIEVDAVNLFVELANEEGVAVAIYYLGCHPK